MKNIQPRKPQQNADIEFYNRNARYNWLAQCLFESVDQVRESATRWLWTYNNERTNMALGGITPKQKFAVAAWFYFCARVKMGDFPPSTFYNSERPRRNPSLDLKESMCR